jgi:hypothetical protein
MQKLITRSSGERSAPSLAQGNHDAAADTPIVGARHWHGNLLFQAMAPILIANVLTVTFVYCFAKIHQMIDD